MDNGHVRVLLVEDDPDDYYLTREMLADAAGGKIALDWAKDYESGLDAMKGCDHDAYLLDYRLGKQNGLDLWREGVSMGCAGPAILLTGQSDRELAIRALDAGASDYLVKGEFDAAALERSIRYALQQTRHARELEQKVHDRTVQLEDANEALKSNIEELSRTTDRLRLQNFALAESEQRFAAIVGQTTAGMVQTDLTGKILFTNGRFCEITGYECEELLKMRLHDLTHEEDLPGGALLFEKTAAEGTPFTIEKRYVRKDDSSVWIHCTVSAILGGEGRPKYILAVALDITESKLLEQKIVGQNAIFEAVATGRPLEEILHLITEAAERQFPASMCSVLLAGTGGTQLFNGSARSLPPEYNAAIDGIIIGEGVGSCGTAAFRRSIVIVSDTARDPLWADFRELARVHELRACWSMPIVSPVGELLGTFAIYFRETRVAGAEDVPALELAANVAGIAIGRKQVEEKLRESEEKFRTLADNMSQFAWMADEKGWIFWYNERWHEYTGKTLQEMQGWGWMTVHHPDHVDRVVERIQRSWDTGEPWEDTFPLRGKDGKYCWFLSRALPIRDADGKVIRWFGTNTDVTERMEADEALRRNMDELSQFNRAMVGRELRMIELKEEVNELCRVTGEEKRYTLDFEEN